MNLEDKVDNYLRMYIQKDIPITREQAEEINEYKCELRNRIDKAIEYMHNFDIFDKFSFPLMKKWEEQQVKSSIEYEFNNSLYKDLLEILKGKSE